MYSNEAEDLDQVRKELAKHAALQELINVNLTAEQMEDLRIAITREIVQVATSELRRIAVGREYLTRKQARKYLSVSDDVLQKWIDRGMPYTEVDGIIRFHRLDLDSWLAYFTVVPEFGTLEKESDPYWQNHPIL